MYQDSEELSIRQNKAVPALITCRPVAETAKLAAVGERSIYLTTASQPDDGTAASSSCHTADSFQF